MLIGLGHAARVGKDTAAEILVERHGFTRLAFADALRDVAYESNPDVRRLVDYHGWDTAKVAYPKVRQYLIDLGNACRNHISPDVWVEAVFNQILAGRDYVISDVRYPNELHAIVDHGGVAVKITRPGIEPMENVADQALAGFCGWGQVVENGGTQDDLAEALSALVTHHRNAARTPLP